MYSPFISNISNGLNQLLNHLVLVSDVLDVILSRVLDQGGLIQTQSGGLCRQVMLSARKLLLDGV